MSATTVTTFGTGDWGINNDQVGIIIQSQSDNYKNESKEVKNRVGNCVGKTFYNETVETSIDGILPVTSPFTGKIASSLALGNPLSGFLQEPLTNGINLIDTITVDKANEDYKKVKISTVFYPFFSA